VHQPLDDKFLGVTLGFFGQYFSRHEAWAPLARPWIDYIARNSFMLQQGRNVADIAYFYGEEAPLTALYGEHPVAGIPAGHPYDFVNADALFNALSNDGSDIVTSGSARYRLLYLGGSSTKLTVAALQRLQKLAEGGATIVGLAPEESPALTDAKVDFDRLVGTLWAGQGRTVLGKGQVIATADLADALAMLNISDDFRAEGGRPDTEVSFIHRRLSDGDSYFLLNLKDRVEPIEAHFRITGKAPELWHAETGKTEPVSYRVENGETVVPLTLEGEGAVHVVFRKPSAVVKQDIAKPVLVDAGKMEGAWTVRFQPDRGAPEMRQFTTLTPWDENAEPGIRYFSGIATYEKSFTAPKGWKPGAPLWLDLGEVHEVAEVSVNGRVAGSAWHAPDRVDIGGLAKRGANRISIRVANLWVNRLVGDAQPGAKPITFTTGANYEAKEPLRRSGLIGPVTLLTEKR
jgi:hypothetical protein